MNKYDINYVYGTAYFYCEADDDIEVTRDFQRCAACCFGIRKSLGDVGIVRRYANVELPLPYRDKGGTHLLIHSGGDTILFDASQHTDNGEPWKLMSEWGEWCSCKERGKAELSCGVHHFWVLDHDKVCDCQKQ